MAQVVQAVRSEADLDAGLHQQGAASDPADEQRREQRMVHRGNLGETRAAAGLWGCRTRLSVESFAVVTVQDKSDRWVPLELEAWDWHAWLDGKISLETIAMMPVAILERTV